MERDEGRGRVALVTGGASGIGFATAGVLAARNWRVVISDLDADRTARAAADLGVGHTAFDVADEHATQAALARIEAEHGPVEALFANAGVIQPGGTPETLPMEDFDCVVAVNLRGVYVSCAVFGGAMAKRGGGGIVITGSITATRVVPLHAYAPTKAAVVHLAACLAAEWGRSGVRVNAVSPGFVATPPVRAAIQRGLRDPELLKEASSLGRLVEPEEIGKGVAFLLSDDAAAITGINLPVDAGWLAGSAMGSYGGVRPAR